MIITLKIEQEYVDVDVSLLDKEEYQAEVRRLIFQEGHRAALLTPNKAASYQCKSCGHIEIGYQDEEVCEDCGEDDLEFKVTVPEAEIYMTEEIPPEFIESGEILEEFWEFQELVYNNGDLQEMLTAAAALGISMGAAEDAYQGEFGTDGDFAYHTHQMSGEAVRSEWPHSCIDWEWAARELMMDYTEQDGHYFNNNW